jgi:hypothetical protein
MYVLFTLVLVPLGLVAVIAMSWMEDHFLPPRGTALRPGLGPGLAPGLGPGPAVPVPSESDVRTRPPTGEEPVI